MLDKNVQLSIQEDEIDFKNFGCPSYKDGKCLDTNQYCDCCYSTIKLLDF